MNRNHRIYLFHILVALTWITLPSVQAQGADALAAADGIVRSSGRGGGMCVVVGRRDADLGVAIAKQGSFVVHCLAADRSQRDRMRQAIRRAGMYGDVSAQTHEAGKLPYIDSFLNIAVIESWPTLTERGLALKEVLRVLSPLGTAFIDAKAGARARIEAKCRELGAKATSFGPAGRWVRVQKPWPKDIDEWTHYLHGPDGNPVAQDEVVGPPKHYQWISKPMWLRSHETDSSVSTLVTARGRLFSIIDEAPISLAGPYAPPDKWALVARDAFNGVLLWRIPIRRWGWREWKKSWFSCRPGDMPLNIRKRLVAVGDKVYVTLGYRAPVSEIDANTGEILKTYAATEGAGEVLVVNGALVLAVVDDYKCRVMAVDAASGKTLWKTEKLYAGTTVDYIRWRAMHGKVEAPRLDPALNLATDGQVAALIDGDKIVCLDLKTGAEKWRAAFPTVEADKSAGGIRAQGKLWNGTMIVRDGVVIHASPNQLAAFSADTGKLLWSQPKKYIGHLWYEWKDVFVIDGLVWTWSPELGQGTFDIGRGRKQRTLYPKSVNGYDVLTGELKKKVPLGAIFKANHHHRCYRNKATTRYILASRRGTEFVDLKEGKHTVHNWVRGTCHVGMMPANGLQYAPPHPCPCYIDEKLSGMNALAPAGRQGAASPAEKAKRPRLERGPAYSEVRGQKSEVSDADWPAFRHDAMRTGAAATRVPDRAARAWRVKLGRKVSPPIAVADRVYVSLVDEHHVVCLDAADGKKLWEFAAGGRIDSPPTYYDGALLFGSMDGNVYCLRASDGQLAWRFRAAPEERFMGAFGQMESVWPVHGSVLVQKGVVYFSAGRSSELDGGIRVYAVDAATGELLHHKTLSGPDYAAGDFGENFKLPMGSLPGILTSDGKRIYMRSLTFDSKLDLQRGRPALQPRHGFLDGTYFKRVPWTYKGKDPARLIVHDKRSVYYVRMFDTLRGLDPTVFFTPGRKGYLLFAKNMGGGKPTWQGRVPVRIRAMALTPERLYVAGPPDIVDPRDPLGAFEGRKGGLLYAIDAKTGDRVREYRLESPPVFNGSAAARGRLYIAEKDGSLACFAGR